MSNHPSSFCAVAALALLAGGGQAQTLNVKTGVWESSVTSATGGIALPSELLAKLVPEQQREKFEEAIGALPNQSRVKTQKYCLTQKDLDEDRYFEKKTSERCSRRVLSKSNDRVEFEQSCNGTPPIATMHVIVQAIDPERVKVTVDALIGGVGKTRTEMSAHWLGASCQGKG